MKFFFLASCLILIKFSLCENRVCYFLNTEDEFMKIVKCNNSKNQVLKNKCTDPNDSVLEQTFARFEFKLLSNVNLMNGVGDYESDFREYIKFRQIINETEYTETNCKFTDFRTDNVRSICPWNNYNLIRDNLYPRNRKTAKCMQNCSKNCESIKPIEIKNGDQLVFIKHKCVEKEKFELVLYRKGECDKSGINVWDIGLEVVAHSCSCDKYEDFHRN
jgi:hypothetical protein